MAKYESAPVEKGPSLSSYVFYEGDEIYTRDVISITTEADIPMGTILERTGETWAKASAGTGYIGMLAADIKGRSSAQEAVVITRMAGFKKSTMLIDGGILEAAAATLESQGIKLA